MSVSISNNIAALAATFNIDRVNNSITDSVSRLSSGNRVVRASDDILAMGAGTKLSAQLRSMQSAQTNVNQGISMLDTADAGISEIIALLEDQLSISVSAQSGALTALDRANLDVEFQDIMDQIDAIATSTTFGDISLLDGGLGTATTLFTTDATASNFDPSSADISSGSSAQSQVAIEGFNLDTGVFVTTVGPVRIILVDGTDTLLTDDAFLDVDSRVYGQFSDFSITDVTYGASATLNGTMNGVTYSGSFNDGDNVLTIENGTTRLRLRTSAGLDLTDAASVATSEAQTMVDFSNIGMLRSGTITGVDFTGTRLEDAVGTAGQPLATTRLMTGDDNVDISNFEYVGNGGAANTSVLSVQINGETFTATSVADTIDDGAATVLAFENGTGEALLINITGLTSGTNTAITNIRTDLDDRSQFINALNVGFSRAGGGLEFNVSGLSNDEGLFVQINAATSANLYGGQSYDVTSIANAAIAETAVNAAIDAANAIQAQIASTQLRFESAGDYLADATIDIDAARSNYLDTDITEESTKLASNQVLLQAGVAALAQANQLPSDILDILNMN